MRSISSTRTPRSSIKSGRRCGSSRQGCRGCRPNALPCRMSATGCCSGNLDLLPPSLTASLVRQGGRDQHNTSGLRRAMHRRCTGGQCRRAVPCGRLGSTSSIPNPPCSALAAACRRGARSSETRRQQVRGLRPLLDGGAPRLPLPPCSVGAAPRRMFDEN